ncbi:MAG TPA: asparagine synthase-related protein, partial [Candidatus Babeliales bacterium]|nr:asparagine synthase-related protein [Candidatus Babeliales bacterium]
MLGIVSNQMIDKSSIRTMLLSLGFKEDINSFISYNSWAVVCGLEMFEGKAVSVVLDSDLYNLQELSSLVDDKLQNNAHLICLLYLKYGLLFFEKLRGPFSICIIDKKKQKFFVVTDRFGIKPIVYYLNENLFIFGPRIKVIQSVLQSKIDEIDYEAVVDYINLSAIPTPKTIFKKVKKLPPGHFLVINKDENSPQIHKYYDIEYSEKKSGEEYFLSELPLSIEESVRTILEYEFSRGSSVGAFLSGGTDSSTVTGMIKKLNGHVKTFSIGFDEPGYNELKYARITSKYFSSEHYEYIVTPDDVLKALDIILDVYDEPFGNASGVPTYFCAFLAKKHGVDALFAGDGGDEIFGGNERYAANNMFSLYHKIPSILRERLLEPGISKLPSAIPFVEKGKKYIRRANIPQPDRFYSY